MSKSEYLKIRLELDEAREIERAARALSLSKSQYARLLITGGPVQKPQQPPPPAIDEAALADIKAELADMRESLVASARAFDELLAFLKEQQRVPTFREYRARCAAESITKRENETEQQYLLRLASRYFVLYQNWPTPADSAAFGPLPNGVDPKSWPPIPPR